MADDEQYFGNNGNGHGGSLEDTVVEERAKGAVFELDGRRRGDGNVVQGMEQQLGVMQKMATAPTKDDEYRQALLLANFLSTEESDRAVNAIAFCRRYGGDLTPIIDKIIARCAVKGARVSEIVDALTHLRMTTNAPKPSAKSNSRSPIN